MYSNEGERANQDMIISSLKQNWSPWFIQKYFGALMVIMLRRKINYHHYSYIALISMPIQLFHIILHDYNGYRFRT